MNDVAIVAAVQFNPELLNVQKNLAVATELAFEAAAKGARVIVLPELCTSGFALRSPREAMECAQERDGYQTEAFIPIANRYNCYIVFGYPELYEGKLYNSAAIVGPSSKKCYRSSSRFKFSSWRENRKIFLISTEQQSCNKVSNGFSTARHEQHHPGRCPD
jgi:predicted amidohydrolase